MWRAPNLYGGHFQVFHAAIALTTVNFYKSLLQVRVREWRAWVCDIYIKCLAQFKYEMWPSKFIQRARAAGCIRMGNQMSLWPAICITLRELA